MLQISLISSRLLLVNLNLSTSIQQYWFFKMSCLPFRGGFLFRALRSRYSDWRASVSSCMSLIELIKASVPQDGILFHRGSLRDLAFFRFDFFVLSINYINQAFTGGVIFSYYPLQKIIGNYKFIKCYSLRQCVRPKAKTFT